MSRTVRFSGLVCLLLGVFLAQTALAAQTGIDVTVDRSYNADVTVTFPALKFGKGEIDGKKAVALFAPGTTLSEVRGQPEIPLRSGFLMLSPEGKPELKILGKEYQTIELDGRLRPSKGAIARNVDPRTVPYEFGKVYEKNAWFPSDQELVTLGSPFIFRDVRGTRLTAAAVQYNPATGQLRVYSSIRARMTLAGKGANPQRGKMLISRVFEPTYRRFFLNFQPMAMRLPRLGENGRLLIIAADPLYEAILPLMAWKLKCGFETKAVRLSEIGGATPEAIKAFLQAEFNGKGFTHVILVGDAPQLPTNKGANQAADSDPCYVKLAGDDHVPDAIISRISATTAAEAAYQAAKFINYEQFPSEGEDAAWYSQAMGIASSEGSPTDFERMNQLREVLLKDGRFASVDQIYDAVSSSGGGNGGGNDYPPGPWGGPWGGPFGPGPHLPPMIELSASRSGGDADKAEVAKGVNAGRSLIAYIGHGSKDAWVTSGFGTADCRDLQNKWKLPLIISVACVNGDFVSGPDCFSEAWMKAGDIENPRGAIGIFGSTTNQDWVPPCDVQKEILTNFLVNDTYKTVGALVMNGIMKGLEQHGTEAKTPGVRMAEQWHWFGDCTTLYRTRRPVSMKVDVKPTAGDTECQADFIVLTTDGKPVQDAHVTFYSGTFETWVTGRTSPEGKVSLKIPAPRGLSGYYTIIGANLVPQVDEKISF